MIFKLIAAVIIGINKNGKTDRRRGMSQLNNLLQEQALCEESGYGYKCIKFYCGLL